MASENNIFKVNVYDKSTLPKTLVGTTDATIWTDPVSKTEYTVPFGYDPKNTDKFRAVQNRVDEFTQAGDMKSARHAALQGMFQNIGGLIDYKTGDVNDLQRGFNGQNFGGFVEEFTPIASFDVGVACGAAGYTADICKAGGGAVNLKNRINNTRVDISGEFFNNPKNVPNIEAGVSYFNHIDSKERAHNLAKNPSVMAIAERFKAQTQTINQPPQVDTEILMKKLRLNMKENQGEVAPTYDYAPPSANTGLQESQTIKQ